MRRGGSGQLGKNTKKVNKETRICSICKCVEFTTHRHLPLNSTISLLKLCHGDTTVVPGIVDTFKMKDYHQLQLWTLSLLYSLSIFFLKKKKKKEKIKTFCVCSLSLFLSLSLSFLYASCFFFTYFFNFLLFHLLIRYTREFS